ncbi:MAG: PhzF family phenazine biosynthesis protein [bacterium]
MQYIAAENNLAETAFFVKEPAGYRIRWFTPLAEVDLCGHATLATAHVMYEHLGYQGDRIEFQSRSGLLHVKREAGLLILDFPRDEFFPTELPEILIMALGKRPVESFKGKTDYMLVYEDHGDIKRMNPDFSLLGKVAARGIIVTAPGKKVDFVSRFFAPQVGVHEDPVTGSAHTTLTPYWCQRLKKTELTAIQISQRKGYLTCKLVGDRVEISGKAVTYLEGMIHIMR